MHTNDSLYLGFIGINSNVINSLTKELNNTKHIYRDYTHKSSSTNLDPYSFFYPINIKDKKRDILSLHTKYPMLSWIKSDFTFISPKYIFGLEPTPGNYSKIDYFFKDLNEIIIKHNKSLVLPSKINDEMLVNKLLIWFNHNTPGPTSMYVTPLCNTGYLIGIDSKSSLDIYNQWLVSTFMLILEFNCLNKAWLYLNNPELRDLSKEFRKSYELWINRQLEILYAESSGDFFYLDKNNLPRRFIPTLWLDGDMINREIAEDMLYVLLNILLSKSILTNPLLRFYINNDKLFFKELESIITKHYNLYDKEYVSLHGLREYKCYNFLSLEQIQEWEKSNN
jgi:hypothetical protein